MRHSPLPMLLFAVVAIAACSDRAPDAAPPEAQSPAPGEVTPPEPPMPASPVEAVPTPTPAATASAAPEADYLGRWTGVEGMYLVVTTKPAGGVTLEMQWDLDHKGVFDGSVTAEGLRFMRDGVAETAVRGNGDATGLKHLAGKQDCLVVKPGEGYCRD